jgi:ribosome modulation factor
MKVHAEIYAAIRDCPKAYEEGTDAGMNGKDAADCPYKEGTPERLAWRAGFLGVS